MFWTVTLSLLGGMGQLLKLFFLTLLFSLPLGLLIAFALRSRCRPVSWLFNVIVWIIRGTPLMLQLIIIFYGPGKWFDNNIWANFNDPRMAACVIAFVINDAVIGPRTAPLSTGNPRIFSIYAISPLSFPRCLVYWRAGIFVRKAAFL